MVLLYFYSPANILNNSQMPLIVNDNFGAAVLSPIDDYTNAPIVEKNNSNKEVSLDKIKLLSTVRPR